MGTRIAVMNEGLLQQVGTPQALYDTPINRFVAGFIGSPSMNFVEVHDGRAPARARGWSDRPTGRSRSRRATARRRIAARSARRSSPASGRSTSTSARPDRASGRSGRGPTWSSTSATRSCSTSTRPTRTSSRSSTRSIASGPATSSTSSCRSTSSTCSTARRGLTLAPDARGRRLSGRPRAGSGVGPGDPSGADLVERVVDSPGPPRGRYLTFRIDTIERADGSRGTRDIAGHPGAVAILAHRRRGSRPARPAVPGRRRRGAARDPGRDARRGGRRLDRGPRARRAARARGGDRDARRVVAARSAGSTRRPGSPRS